MAHSHHHQSTPPSTAAAPLSQVYIFYSRVGVQKFSEKSHPAAIKREREYLYSIKPKEKRRVTPKMTKMVEETEDYSAAEEADSYIWIDPISGKKTGGNDKKRRFSAEQVKSLEFMFETQTKLEQREKLQLAKELGLHPRQVAIWFQNKRARWKSKQLEREYNALRADYEALLSDFESLKNEKQLLAQQLQKLEELLDKPVDERGKESDCRKVDQRPNSLLTEKTDLRLMSSDDEENHQGKYGEETELFCEPNLGNSLVPSSEQQQQLYFHQPSWPQDQSCATPQWWEFWPMNE